eukprot:152519_1
MMMEDEYKAEKECAWSVHCVGGLRPLLSGSSTDTVSDCTQSTETRQTLTSDGSGVSIISTTESSNSDGSCQRSTLPPRQQTSLFGSSSSSSSFENSIDRHGVWNMGVEHCGWLMKVAGMKVTKMSFKPRWFQAFESRLRYFSDSHCSKLLGNIVIADIAVVELHDLRPFGFALVTEGGKSFVLAANSETERRVWISLLRTKLFSMRPRMFAVRSVVKHGAMQKRGRRRKSWKHRFFLLSDSTLMYFRSASDLRYFIHFVCSEKRNFEKVRRKYVLGEMSIAGSIVAQIGSFDRHHNCLKLTSSDSSRALYLSAPSVTDARAWDESLRRARAMAASVSGLAGIPGSDASGVLLAQWDKEVGGGLARSRTALDHRVVMYSPEIHRSRTNSLSISAPPTVAPPPVPEYTSGGGTQAGAGTISAEYAALARTPTEKHNRRYTITTATQAPAITGYPESIRSESLIFPRRRRAILRPQRTNTERTYTERTNTERTNTQMDEDDRMSIHAWPVAESGLWKGRSMYCQPDHIMC